MGRQLSVAPPNMKRVSEDTERNTSQFIAFTFKLHRPRQALTLQEGCGSLSRHSAHEGGKALSPTHRPPLLPRKYSWYIILLAAESITGPYYVNEKFQ